ncbi:MAG: helix-turn-helix transcriptional regulator [Pseudomonadota bacterium]
MKNRLIVANITGAMEKIGLSQTAVSESLGVSRQAISQWLNEDSFPRPNKLLQLGKLLNLSFTQLVSKEDDLEPKVAFRKMKGTKTKPHHIEKAQEMGRFLSHLVTYIPFDIDEMPPVLKEPVLDYDYLQRVVSKVRQDINVEPLETINFSHLIRRFRDLQTVIIPVLWGSKKRHENALHIYLPQSQTTWVYLNLDVNIHDFKFWMSHELGHCFSPSLEGNEAEDFADAFAGALLCPHDMAEDFYRELNNSPRTTQAKLKKLMQLADKQIISPNTIVSQLKKYAIYTGKSEINFGKALYGWITNFNKKYHNLSYAMLGDVSHLEPREYIQETEKNFETDFFNLLKVYLKDTGKGAGYVQSVLDIPLMDSKGIYTELT